VNAGAPVVVEFSIMNETAEPLSLFVPGTDPEIGDASMGLPMSHVFSGERFEGLRIRGEYNRTWDVPVGYRPPATAPVVTLGPHQSIGISVDVQRFYPPLRTPGTYRLTWAPYGGLIESNMLVIKVGSLKQALIVTDHGEMKVRFFYDETPRHVENFIELCRDRFYDNLTFHRIESGFFIQGGCPNGDGTGIRPDGVKIPGEFTSRPQKRGTVSMALLDDDPDSASCQFFIANTDIPEWTGRYTIFGKLFGEESFATLDRLMSVETDDEGRPLKKIFIRTIRISDVPRDFEETVTER
jgi:cyclophilin family peptidyl-prolyl cis-trans isomerase